MLDGKAVVALVPARRGSKGIPGKNNILVAGRPLLAWSILAARGSSIVDHVVVSSDDTESLRYAVDFGATPLARPVELAADDTPSAEVIRHALESEIKCDVLVLLQPTSPLRTAEHIDEALTLLMAGTANSVVSVCESPVAPELLFRLGDKGMLSPVLESQQGRRQDFQKTYLLNGAIYGAHVSDLESVAYSFSSLTAHPYIMRREDSLDIDDSWDLQEAHSRLENQMRFESRTH